MTLSLKPCPFCGNEAPTLDDTSCEEAGGYFIQCWGEDGCGACHWGNNRAEAITAWNTRTPTPDTRVEALALHIRNLLSCFNDAGFHLSPSQGGSDTQRRDVKAAAEALALLDTPKAPADGEKA